MSKSFRDESRADWEQKGRQITDDRLKIGCLQRIADAVEKMAERHTELIADLNFNKSLLTQEEKKVLFLEHKCAAYKGVITKLKKQGLPF